MENLDNSIAALTRFDALNHELTIFMKAIADWLSTHPSLVGGKFPLLHTVKSRVKDREHLREKINRKQEEGIHVDGNNLSQEITDLTGVRVLHIHQEQAKNIHAAIIHKIDVLKDWVLHEPPKAYTWDPESKRFFEEMGVAVEVKESFYTSLHYVVRPKEGSPLVCEIQVRTLFEEIWGEVDHSLNYPVKSKSLACREQLLVLAKVVGAGSRLLDSIFRTENPVVLQPIVKSALETNLKEDKAGALVDIAMPVPVVTGYAK
ncbi:hypothetical protein GCM10007320_40680 [Pseudorhodoferax aquiterrae]|uniref:RelA/SpoT domain-containing protein n=1 Tax=Pseudorhodoferax aquiterrae TaxID=747304 RepID=A0ABQ3G5E3_9BURK|nr:RelA/SpoT domain-containing protein [Pseudorhodoferax aquiterrae]GHC91560.1 hypothetical protein GCM10007320_40680 [Pseudorhodoferax aquiterrae]